MSDIASPVQRVGVAEQDFEAVVSSMRPAARLLAFGVFELDTLTGELRKEGRLLHLRHQPVNVLRLLLEGAGDLVTRREITEALWPDDVDVDVEQGLNHCMKEIRAVLGDSKDSPRFIQTLPRRGYRFLLEVRTRERGTRAGAEAPAPPLEPPSSVVEAAPQISVPDPEADPLLGDGRFE